MSNALLEFISVGLRHISEIRDLKHRAESLCAVAKACTDAGFHAEAEELQQAARDLMQADQAQLRLNERFSNFADS